MERDMRAFLLVLAAFLALVNNVEAQPAVLDPLRLADSICQGETSDAARVQCFQVVIKALKASAPCTGKAEDRFICLEVRIAQQAHAILRLRYELERRSEPRVQPLDGPYLSER
jgi:hypothetical protein